jgi:co-chaperonin GroES (HSP10)
MCGSHVRIVPGQPTFYHEVRDVSIEFRQILLDDFIVVALLEEPAAQGRIKLPDWQRTLRGEVTAAGPGRMLPFGGRAPMECKVGDIVTFAATAGMDSDFGIGRKVRMMHDTDVDTVECAGE